jgi:FkbM family methyltransferase
LGSSGKVYAFEPVPFTFETLQLVSRILGFRNVTLVEKGCSEAGGRISFEVPVQASGAFAAGQAYIGGRRDDREGKEQQVRWAGTRQVECEVVALDEFLPKLKDLSLIKCDVEGAELLAFRGAKKLIAEHLPSIICEINPWFLEGFGIRLDELLDFFGDQNYGLYFYRQGEGPALLTPVEAKDVVEDNYIFIHPSRLERFSSILAQPGS